MKKVILSLSVALGLSQAVHAAKYKVDEASLDKLVAQSTEVSAEYLNTQMNNQFNGVNFMIATPGEKTRGGYLLRAFFCGAIALHRYYMGTNEKWMWALYFCIPVVGRVTACVDFWGAVFNSEFYKKYENNDKYIVWLN